MTKKNCSVKNTVSKKIKKKKILAKKRFSIIANIEFLTGVGGWSAKISILGKWY